MMRIEHPGRAVFAAAAALCAAIFTGCATGPAPAPPAAPVVLPPGDPAAHEALPKGHPDVSMSPAVARQRTQTEAMTRFILGSMASDEGRVSEAISHMEAAAKLDPEAPEPAEALMNLYQRSGQVDRAREAAERVLKIREGSIEAHVVLGQTALESQDNASAIRHFTRAWELAPKNASLMVTLADLYEKEGRLADALAVLGKLAENEEHAPVAYYYMARVHAREGQTEKSLQALERAIDLNPSFLTAVNDLASIYEQDERIDDAVKVFRLYLQRRGPDSTVQESLAHMYLRAGRLGEARKELEDLLTREPDRASALILLGLTESQDGNFENALALMSRVREKSPRESVEIIMHIGTLQRELKRYEEALATFTEAARAVPNRYEPHLNLAVVLDQLDRKDEALDSLKTALALEPDRVNVRIYMAQLLMRMDQAGEAAKVLEEGLENSPENTVLLYQLAIVQDRSGDFPRAERTLQGILAIDPKHHDAMNYLGYTWADKGIRLDEAQDLIEKALQIKPDANYIIDSLGWVYFRLGRYQEALDRILKALEGMPDDATVLEHAGDACHRLGQVQKAREYWEKALKADPGNARLSDKIQGKDPSFPPP